jgi:hypothetical protein
MVSREDLSYGETQYHRYGGKSTKTGAMKNANDGGAMGGSEGDGKRRRVALKYSLADVPVAVQALTNIPPPKRSRSKDDFRMRDLLSQPEIIGRIKSLREAGYGIGEIAGFLHDAGAVGESQVTVRHGIRAVLKGDKKPRSSPGSASKRSPRSPRSVVGTGLCDREPLNLPSTKADNVPREASIEAARIQAPANSPIESRPVTALPVKKKSQTVYRVSSNVAFRDDEL